MDNPRSRYQLEQENLALRDSLRREKLKKADELFAHRLVFSGIIGVILFLTLCALLERVNYWLQWAWVIGFFAAALLIVGKISLHYKRDKEDADK